MLPYQPQYIKARKEAKSNAAAARTSTDIKYTVAITSFVPMAERIAPDINRPQKVQEDKSIHITEVHDTFDMLTMWHLLMSDVNKTRIQVRWARKRCLDSDFDLTSTAVATDVEIHIAQDLTNQSSELFQKHDRILEIAKIHFKQAATEQDFTQEVAAFNTNCDKKPNLYMLYNKTLC
jgi:hypothetical protein